MLHDLATHQRDVTLRLKASFLAQHCIVRCVEGARTLARAATQFPRAERLRLINLHSSKRWYRALVRFELSLAAKSASIRQLCVCEKKYLHPGSISF